MPVANSNSCITPPMLARTPLRELVITGMVRERPKSVVLRSGSTCSEMSLVLSLSLSSAWMLAVKLRPFPTPPSPMASPYL